MIFPVRAPDTKTLGSILFADKAKVRVSEDEWLELVRAVGDGDQRALHSLYEQTYRIVFTLIVRITANQETAEEVTLDVFYDVWRKASTYDPANGSVVGWIINQARSRAIDRLRFDQRKKRVNTYPDSLRPATDVVDPQQAFLFEEQSRLLRNALEILSRRFASRAGSREILRGATHRWTSQQTSGQWARASRSPPGNPRRPRFELLG